MACGAEKRSKLRGMKPKKRFKNLKTNDFNELRL